MSLNTTQMKQASGNSLGYPTVGPHVARLIGIVDLGKQDRQAYKGQAKSPCGQLVITFELTDDFVEIDGVKKPRWFSKKLNAFSGPNSNLTEMVSTLDPANTYGGDLAAMTRATIPCLVSIAQKTDQQTGQTIEGVRISQVSSLPPGFAAPVAQNAPLVFDWEAPDMTAYDRLPGWVQEQIKKAHDFAGSKIQPLIAAYDASKAQNQVQNQTQAAPSGSSQAVAAAPAQSPAPTGNAPVAAQGAGTNSTPTAPPGWEFDTVKNTFVPAGTATKAAPPATPAKIKVTMGPGGWAQDSAGQWVQFDAALHEVDQATGPQAAPVGVGTAQGNVAPVGGRPY